ncbi:hypothetical protein QGN29_11210 [Temperatibacter marinus]|uniref:Uncharacterized protein n=1 Tax=Temperatibacter marinus TaxID=1456591 RepID=A0AA52EB67_9PROT|nr:hypothetical protein [Temperatibacter marinus]WND02117.1 hypothetical protein QGN29_11210 [Temperatibacter marinus]
MNSENMPDLNGLKDLWQADTGQKGVEQDVAEFVSRARKTVFRLRLLFMFDIISSLIAMGVLGFVLTISTTVPFLLLFAVGQIFCLVYLWYAISTRRGLLSFSDVSSVDLIALEMKRAQRLIHYINFNFWMVIPMTLITFLALWGLADMKQSWSHEDVLFAIYVYGGLYLSLLPLAVWAERVKRKQYIKINEYSMLIKAIEDNTY